MAISTTGRKIKAKRKGQLTEIDNANPHHRALLKYSHLRVQFPDGEEKHLLFTDSQVKRGIYRASKNDEDLPKTTWLREVWYEGLIETGISDLQDVVNQKKLPTAALKYNHIRVECDNKECHLLLTDYDIKVALKRADKNPEDLPSISWLADVLD